MEVHVVHKLPIRAIWFKLQPSEYIKYYNIFNSHESDFKGTWVLPEGLISHVYNAM